MLDRASSVPLYRQLKELLVAQIGALPAHARIPSEPELTRRLGVSRATVQQAVAELVREGLLYRVRGKGTFVSPPRILRSFSHLPSYSEDIRRRGLEPGVRELAITKEAAPPKVAAALQLSPGADVWRVHRVQTANGDPVARVISYLPVRALPVLREEEVARSLYRTIETHLGSRPAWAHDTYRAENAGPETARLLGVPVGAALLVSERVAYLPDDRPIEYVLSYIRGDRFEIHVEINHKPEKGARAHGSPC